MTDKWHCHCFHFRKFQHNAVQANMVQSPAARHCFWLSIRWLASLSVELIIWPTPCTNNNGLPVAERLQDKIFCHHNQCDLLELYVTAPYGSTLAVERWALQDLIRNLLRDTTLLHRETLTQCLRTVAWGISTACNTRNCTLTDNIAKLCHL